MLNGDGGTCTLVSTGLAWVYRECNIGLKFRTVSPIWPDALIHNELSPRSLSGHVTNPPSSPDSSPSLESNSSEMIIS